MWWYCHQDRRGPTRHERHHTGALLLHLLELLEETAIIFERYRCHLYLAADQKTTEHQNPVIKNCGKHGDCDRHQAWKLRNHRDEPSSSKQQFHSNRGDWTSHTIHKHSHVINQPMKLKRNTWPELKVAGRPGRRRRRR